MISFTASFGVIFEDVGVKFSTRIRAKDEASVGRNFFLVNSEVLAERRTCTGQKVRALGGRVPG